MRVGVLCRSEYEWAAHSRDRPPSRAQRCRRRARRRGPSAPGGGPLETALLRAADELYRDDVVGDATWDALAAELSEQQLLDLLFTVGGYRSAT